MVLRLVSVSAAGLLALYALVAAYVLGDPTRTTIPLAVLYTLPIIMLAVVSFHTTAARSGKEARLWRLIGIMAVLLLVGDGLAAFQQSIVDPLGADPWLISEIGYVVGLVTWIPILMLLTEPFEVIGLRKARAALDLVSVFVFVLLTVFLVVIRPLGTQYGIPFGDAVIEIVDLAAATAGIMYLVLFKRSEWQLWHVSLAAMFLLFGIADGWNSVLDSQGIERFSEWSAITVDLLFMAGYSFVAVAAAIRTDFADRHERGTRRQGLRLELDLPRWPGTVAQVVALFAIPIALIAGETELLGAWTTPERWTLIVGASLLTTLIVIRAAIVSHENRQLLAKNLIDPLTGLGNLRHYREQLRKDVDGAMSAKEDIPFGLCILDIDGLDQVNRDHGTSAGDRLLQAIGAALLSATHETSTPCRIGGDMFAIVVPGHDAIETFMMATRIQAILNSEASILGTPVGTTIGVAALGGLAGSADELDRQARGALYWAKQSQRGGIVVYDPKTVEALDPQEHIESIEAASRSSLVEVLASAVDARDQYTRFHSQSVAELVEVFADHLDLGDRRHQQRLRTAAVLHDIGKIGTPDSILRKPGKLDSNEFALIMEHPELGVKILQASTEQVILPWIRSHHEKWDGSGYPDGLSGETIPLEARVLTLCDSFDAMTSDRPYRAAMTIPDALEEVRSCAGSQFDPELAKHFIEMVKERQVP